MNLILRETLQFAVCRCDVAAASVVQTRCWPAWFQPVNLYFTRTLQSARTGHVKRKPYQAQFSVAHWEFITFYQDRDFDLLINFITTWISILMVQRPKSHPCRSDSEILVKQKMHPVPLLISWSQILFKLIKLNFIYLYHDCEKQEVHAVFSYYTKSTIERTF